MSKEPNFENKGLYWRTPKTKQQGNGTFSIYQKDLTTKLNSNGINMRDLVAAKTDRVEPAHKRLLEIEIYRIIGAFTESR